MDENTDLKILKLADVEAVTKQSRSSIYAKVKRGEFPGQVKLGSRAVGWLEHEVLDWIRQRIAVSRPGNE